MANSPENAAPPGSLHAVTDSSPAYDLLFSFGEIVQPACRRGDRWAAWARETADQLTVAQQRRMQRYHIARAYAALIPTLPEPRSTRQFLHSLAAMPITDFLRVAITSGHTDPDTPLAPADLLEITRDSSRARAFVDRYLRLTGRERTNLLHILDKPEAARAELADLLADFEEGYFAALEPQLGDARQRTAERLTHIASTARTSWPDWIVPYAQLEDFSPVVLAASAFLDKYMLVYYHEIREPLFDGSNYEPFIIAIGEKRLLRPQPLRPRGQRRAPTTLPGDPAVRCSTIFAALADPSRLRLVQLLSERPRYGQELAQELEMSAPTVSHHLNLLLNVGLVTVERKAHRTYYALQTELLAVRLREGEALMLHGASDRQAAHGSHA
jgi:DNA-binding transcriptional ArsR family regulator